YGLASLRAARDGSAISSHTAPGTHWSALAEIHGVSATPWRNSALAALQILTGTGVNADLVPGIDKQGHLDLRTGLQDGGLGYVGGGVAPETGIGLGDLQLHEVGGLHPEDIPLVGHDLTRHVLLHKLEV